jgi:hypothetical protein
MEFKEYLLVCLSEELAEVSQEVSKCLRFTPEHVRPGENEVSNLRRVQLEVMDVFAVSGLLHGLCDIDTGLRMDINVIMADTELMDRLSEKQKRTLDMAEISRKLGTLT